MSERRDEGRADADPLHDIYRALSKEAGCPEGVREWVFGQARAACATTANGRSKGHRRRMYDILVTAVIVLLGVAVYHAITERPAPAPLECRSSLEEAPLR